MAAAPLFASWPQPQPLWACLLVLLMAVWPLVPFVFAARSLLSPEPVSRLALRVLVAGSAVMTYFLIPGNPAGRPVPREWWYAALVAAILTSAVVLWEVRKSRQLG